MKADVIGNFAAAIWVAVLTFFFTPVYVRNLGVEAYGLIGLLAALQASLGLFDLGLSQVLARELARFLGGAVSQQSILNLVRSIEVIAVTIAALLALAIALPADWIAASWLKTKQLDARALTMAVQLMGVIVALRLLEGLYRGALIGLQRQLQLNVITVIATTARTFGSLAIFTYYSRSIDVFFAWQALVSGLAVIAMICVFRAGFSSRNLQSTFSLIELRRISRFALGLTTVSLLSIALTQTDKLLLSALLDLSDFGKYSLAATLAAAPHIFAAPITQAAQPRLAKAVAESDTGALAFAFHGSAQLMSVSVGSAAVVIMVFSYDVLALWLSDKALAAQLAPLVQVLALGSLLNAMMWLPYCLQMAHGWTRLNANTNLVATILLVPLLVLITPIYGAMGAASIWVALNLGFFALSAPLMFRHALKGHMSRWYVVDIGFPLLTASSVALAAKWLTPQDATALGTVFAIGATSALAVLAASATAPVIRLAGLQLIKKARPK